MKKLKKPLSIVLSALMIATTMPVTSVSASAVGNLTVTIDTGEEVTLTDADSDSYYDIGTADELYAFSYAVNEGNIFIDGELTADIVVNEGKMSAQTDSEAVRPWTPIGSDEYAGKFNGNNHSISGLYFDDATASGIGVFSYVKNSEIKNLTLLNSYFCGDYCVGGIAGRIDASTIENCINKGDIKAQSDFGGIAGFIDIATITACSNEGKLISDETSTLYAPMIGGIAGSCFNTNIYDSYNKGAISGVYPLTTSAEIGGIVGYCDVTIIDNCYNEGEIFVNGDYSLAGGIVGYSVNNSEITNCYNIANIIGSAGSAGGIAAQNNSMIKNCYNTGNISTASVFINNIGGIVGSNSNMGTVTNCYNTGITSVIGTNDDYLYIGGVAGVNNYKGTITNCYNTGDASFNGTNNSTLYIGGITGMNYYESIITNCYNTGGINFSVSDNNYSCCLGGVAGYNYNTDKVTNSYYLNTAYDGGINGLDVSGSAEPKTADQFASGEVAYLLQAGVTAEEGEEIPEIWGQKIGTDISPVLGGDTVYLAKDCQGNDVYGNTMGAVVHKCNNGFCTLCGAYEPATLNINGTADDTTDDYYEIDNAGKLYWFADKVYKGEKDINAVLTDDIVVNEGTMTAETDSTSVRHWESICGYNGDFDGNNHTISGLYINDIKKSFEGLFGLIEADATVKNVGVINSYIKADSTTGAVVGRNNGTVENCYNTGYVVGVSCYAHIGGVVGENTGTVENCYNTGFVIGEGETYFVGGVAGSNIYGTIYDCYNTGEVKGFDDVGGVLGRNNGTVENCYNEGTVKDCNASVGGVVGENQELIVNCYNIGEIHGTEYVGGVTGYNGGNVTNCYNIGEIHGTEYVGGVTGYNGGNVTNCYNTGIVKGDLYIGGVTGYNGGNVTNCYNTGIVKGDLYIGGVIGNNYNISKNCYYLNTSCSGGIKGKDIVGSAEAKTAEQFAGGEVAYLLQAGVTAEEGEEIPEIWGQKIGTDKQPVLGGDKVYLVRNCKGEFVRCNNTADEVIAHIEETINGKAPSCTETGLTNGTKCTVCGETLVAQEEIPTIPHTEKTINGKAPSCTETGLTNGTKCTVCGETLVAQEEIPTIPHTEETINGKAPSCTETGLTNGIKCTVCGETLVAQEEIPALPHTEETIKGKAPTCTMTGLTDGTKCTVCGETTVEQEEIKATGHSYENGKCTVCGYKDPVNSTTIYLKPSSNWKKDDARFTAYLWTGSKNTFIDMEDTDGDGYYELTAEKDTWEYIIFGRLSSKAETSWDTIWNQTKDLAILNDDRNCFTIQEGAWDNADGKWSVYTPATTVEIKGEIDLTLEEAEENIFTGTVELEAGTYLFNVAHNGALLGFNSTYADTATIDYSAGNAEATKLNAKGGKYTFTYNALTKVLTIDYEPVVLLGDANMDGTVNISDVILVMKHTVGKITLDDNQCLYADMDSNGRITLVDALYIQKLILNML